MTLERRHVRFLASVTNESEAKLAATCGADIIDCKDPSKGALGALPVDVVRAVRQAAPRDVPVSATIGDLPAEPEPVAHAVSAMAATGADYVKIGFFAGGDVRATIGGLGALPLGRAKLIGVLLADRDPGFTLFDDLRRAGFLGVVIDTAGKDGRTLRDHMSASELRSFVGQAQAAGLLAGLAGSLRIGDIGDLLALEPDVLGFRGALCAGRRREGAIDAAAVRAVRHAISDGAHSAAANAHLEPSL